MAKHNSDGAYAEDRVAGYLQGEGYEIIDRNWKTGWCEIDIVAKKDACLHFVEVKYRSSETAGGGFEYITSQKLNKMDLAARSWIEINGWQGEHVLSAAEVSGSSFQVEFIENIYG